MEMRQLRPVAKSTTWQLPLLPSFHPSVFPPAHPLIRVGYYAKLRVATVHPKGVLYVRMFVTFGGSKEVVAALNSTYDCSVTVRTTGASGQSM